jgi:DNA-binding NarL/FixJ family response regulator
VDPSIRALILTSYDDDEALVSAILAGAVGYLLKQVTGQDLISAIHQAAAGNSMIDPSLRARRLDRVRTGPPRPAELEGLTDQQLRLLELIGEGLTNRQIAERMSAAEKTVKNYTSLVYEKLGLAGRAQAAVLAARVLDHPRSPAEMSA